MMMCLRVSCRTWIRIRQSRGTYTRIRIRTKIARISNTVFNYSFVIAQGNPHTTRDGLVLYK